MAVLARAMKSSQKEDWLPFAEWFVEGINPPQGAVIAPAPPKRWGTKDHAWGWAWALSNVLGLPLRTPLMRVSTAYAQKDLGRIGRGSVRIDLADPEWNCSDYKSVIIVDDIVTTGSTARSCYRAIGSPARAAVWTLFDRISCDAPFTLI
jgi:predicted amidophosphoribosyltransferase